MHPEGREQFQTEGQSSTSAVASIALCVALVAGLGAWRIVLGARLETLSAEQSTLAAEWAATSAHLEKASARRPELELALGGPARIVADRTGPRWSRAFREVAMAAGEKIIISEIHALAKPEDVGACEMRVSGVASGTQPRLELDRFRMTVTKNLQQAAGDHAVDSRFERLEDEPDPPGMLPDQRRATFVIVVSIASVDPSVAASKEGS